MLLVETTIVIRFSDQIMDERSLMHRTWSDDFTDITGFGVGVFHLRIISE